MLAAQVPKVLLEYRAVADEARNAAAYRRIDVPTCLVAGRWSPEPAQRLTSMFAEILPHASCFEVAAGHMAPITHPALVNPIFESLFVRWIPASVARQSASRADLGLRLVSRCRIWLVSCRDLGAAAVRHAGRRAALFRDSSACAIIRWKKDAWHEAPPGMPPGARFAVISGDPPRHGPFVMRVRLPPGYMLPPYRRANEEQIDRARRRHHGGNRRRVRQRRPCVP